MSGLLAINGPLATTPQPDFGSVPDFTADVQVALNGEVLTDSGLWLYVVNDALTESALRIATPAIVDDPGALGDRIVAYRPLGFPAAGAIAGRPDGPFSVEIGFQEVLPRFTVPPVYPSLLPDSSLPTSSQTWSAFSQKEIGFSFTSGAYIGARIDTIRLVPEPASLSFLTSVPFAYAGRRIRRSCHGANSLPYCGS